MFLFVAQSLCHYSLFNSFLSVFCMFLCSLFLSVHSYLRPVVPFQTFRFSQIPYSLCLAFIATRIRACVTYPFNVRQLSTVKLSIENGNSVCLRLPLQLVYDHTHQRSGVLLIPIEALFCLLMLFGSHCHRARSAATRRLPPYPFCSLAIGFAIGTMTVVICAHRLR